MFKVLKKFTKNEEGATLVFVGVCLAVLLGFAALTFDLGRVAATQSDMQAYADHVALAAAGELDGKADSIIRATAAAEDLINDRQTFGTGTQELGEASDYTLRFLSGLPADDTDDDLSSFITTDPLEATLVEVVTRDAPVFLPFYRAFGVLSGNTVNDGITRGRAIAGFTQYACDIAVMMFCLPEDFSAVSARGTTMLMRTGGQNAAWGPGDFGFLDPSQDAIDPNGDCAGLTGVAQDACLIASSGNRTRCFAQRGVDLEPGQKVGIENAVFNTRFDMYNGTMSNNRNNKVFAPAYHRITGLVAGNGGGNQCLGNNTAPSTTSMAFPPDTCHNSTCDRFGDGKWDRIEYIKTNYVTGASTSPEPTTEEDAEAAEADAIAEAITYLNEGGKFAGMEEASRFDFYKKELQDALESVNGRILPETNPDSITDAQSQMCSNVPPSTNPNRRVFIAAGIDCVAQGIKGSAENVAVEEYYEVFLIAPVGDGTGSSGSSNTFDMFVEIIGSAGGDGSGKADDGGIFRDVVELYR